MALKLYAEADWKNYRTWKIQIAADIAGVDLEVVDADPSNAEFRKVSPFGKPVVVTANGPIFESTAILRYIARLRPESGLYGQSLHESGLVDQWVDFGALEVETVRHIWLLPTKGHIKFDGRAYTEAKKELGDALSLLNKHLLHHTYLVGNQITLADISLAAALVEPYAELFDASFRKGFENVTRWFTTVVNQKSFLQVVGKVELAKQEKRPPKPDKQAQDGEKKPQQQKPQQQQQQQQQQKPQQQKPKPEKEKKDESNPEDLGGEEPKPKGKNPLDLLPASSMNLDTLKKLLFSQRPWNADFFKDFWPAFDPEGYSIYFSNYNYNNENRVYFMTCNLIGGFLQRCDEIRKYALGVLILAGNTEDHPPFEVSGIWIFRGTEVPEGMKENPDSEYCTFTKLDHKNKEHREKVESWFFSVDVQIGGAKLKVLDRRWFK